MKTQYTPGPWFNTSQDDTPMGEVMDQPLDSGVTLHISVSGPNAKADACLIATATELLDRLAEAAGTLSACADILMRDGHPRTAAMVRTRHGECLATMVKAIGGPA